MIKIAIALGVLVSATLLMKKTGMSYRQSVLKTIYPAIMWSSKAVGKKQIQINKDNKTPIVSFYSLTTKDINGKDFDFNALKGKKVLIVNTASDCGFTGQYEALEKLQEKYPNNLVIIGFPANDFKEQETKDNESIAAFCKKNYGVSFPLADKIDVKGENTAPIYQWLTQKAKNGVLDASISWNFNKFLLDENGKMIAYFPSNVKPDSDAILSYLK